MALIECYECEKEISDKAPACPHCGAPAGGKKDGVYKTYYESGKLESLATYKDGEQDGPCEIYHKNGQLQEKVTYVAGRRDGLFECYYASGQLFDKGTYVPNPHGGSVYDGPYERYHANGQLQWKGTYNYGRECGEWIEDGETVTHDPCPPDLEGGN